MHQTYNLTTIEDDLPEYKKLAKNFIDPELINWQTLTEKYENNLKSTDTGSGMDEGVEKITKEACSTLGSIVLFTDDNTWNNFKTRVVEHNLRIISKYYRKISTDRLCELLCLDSDTIEKTIAKLVNKGIGT